MFNGESDTISCLIDASADVNEQLRVPGAFFLKTYLVVSFEEIACNASYKPICLDLFSIPSPWGNCIDLQHFDREIRDHSAALSCWSPVGQNDPGKSAFDFLQEMQVPSVFWRTIERENSDTISI